MNRWRRRTIIGLIAGVGVLGLAGLGWLIWPSPSPGEPAAAKHQQTSSPPVQPPRPPSTPTATSSPSPFDFRGKLAIAWADPDRIVGQLVADWKLSVRTTDYYGTGTRRSATRADGGAGMQAIVITDRSGKLRTIVCAAGNQGKRALADDTRRFFYQCALSAVREPDRAALTTWLDRHVSAAVATTNSVGPTLPKMETRAGTLRVVLEYGPGFVSLSASLPE